MKMITLSDHIAAIICRLGQARPRLIQYASVRSILRRKLSMIMVFTLINQSTQIFITRYCYDAQKFGWLVYECIFC